MPNQIERINKAFPHGFPIFGLFLDENRFLVERLALVLYQYGRLQLA